MITYVKTLIKTLGVVTVHDGDKYKEDTLQGMGMGENLCVAHADAKIGGVHVFFLPPKQPKPTGTPPRLRLRRAC